MVLHGDGALALLQILHIIMFAGWTLATAITADEPAWFQSGSLGFSFACATVVVVLVPLVRDAALRQLDAVRRRFPRATPLQRLAGDTARATQEVHATLDAIRPPLLDRTSAMVLLVTAIGGLPFIAWYFVNAIAAKTHPLASPNTYTRELAQELWANNPGSTITMLVLLSYTALLHLVDIIIGAAVVSGRCCKQSSSDEQELLNT
jgi:hypothetical protein